MFQAISDSGYFTGNISSFIDFHLKLLPRKVRSYIQDTNGSLKITENVTPFPDALFYA